MPQSCSANLTVNIPSIFKYFQTGSTSFWAKTYTYLHIYIGILLYNYCSLTINLIQLSALTFVHCFYTIKRILSPVKPQHAPKKQYFFCKIHNTNGIYILYLLYICIFIHIHIHIYVPIQPAFASLGPCFFPLAFFPITFAFLFAQPVPHATLFDRVTKSIKKLHSPAQPRPLPSRPLSLSLLFALNKHYKIFVQLFSKLTQKQQKNVCKTVSRDVFSEPTTQPPSSPTAAHLVGVASD